MKKKINILLGIIFLFLIGCFILSILYFKNSLWNYIGVNYYFKYWGEELIKSILLLIFIIIISSLFIYLSVFINKTDLQELVSSTFAEQRERKRQAKLDKVLKTIEKLNKDDK